MLRRCINFVVIYCGVAVHSMSESNYFDANLRALRSVGALSVILQRGPAKALFLAGLAQIFLAKGLGLRFVGFGDAASVRLPLFERKVCSSLIVASVLLLINADSANHHQRPMLHGNAAHVLQGGSFTMLSPAGLLRQERGVLMRLVLQGKKLPTWEVGAVEAAEQDRGEDFKPMLRVLSHNVWCHVLQQVFCLYLACCDFLARSPCFLFAGSYYSLLQIDMDIIWSSAQKAVANA